jgi:hypothetical protein
LPTHLNQADRDSEINASIWLAPHLLSQGQKSESQAYLSLLKGQVLFWKCNHLLSSRGITGIERAGLRSFRLRLFIETWRYSLRRLSDRNGINADRQELVAPALAFIGARTHIEIPEIIVTTDWISTRSLNKY